MVKSPNIATVKRLFAVSGNVCAFPGCEATLVDPTSGKVTGRICHIKARSPDGPRYDSEQGDAERHAFPNLVLLCPTHHDIIDADTETFSVTRLTAIKHEHEASAQPLPEPSGNVASQLIQNAGIAIGDIQADNVFISQNAGLDRDQVSTLVRSLLDHADRRYEDLQQKYLQLAQEKVRVEKDLEAAIRRAEDADRRGDPHAPGVIDALRGSGDASVLLSFLLSARENAVAEAPQIDKEIAAVELGMPVGKFPDHRLFLIPEIQQFESLLNAEPAPSEAALQRFIETNQKWLLVLGQHEQVMVRVQILDLLPNFLLKRIGQDTWDILDLKRPTEALVVGREGRRHASHVVMAGVAQLRKYLRTLSEQGVQRKLVEQYGVSLVAPHGILLVGREMTLSHEDKRLLAETGGQDVTIYTYDDLLRLARHREWPPSELSSQEG